MPALLLLGPLLAACVYEPPPVAPLPRGPAPVATVQPPRPPATFTVQPGDGLNAVAQSLNVPRSAIIDANGLKPPYGLRIGQVLRIPPVTGYRVEPGQSLNAIAQARGVPVTQLAELNHLSPPYALRSGSELVVPLPPAPPPVAVQPPLPAMTPYPPPPPTPYGSTAPMRPPLGTAVGAAAPLPSSEPVVPPPAPPIPPPPSSVAGRTAFPTTPLAGEGAPLGRPAPPAAAVAGAPLAPLPGSTTTTGPIASVPVPSAPVAGAPVTLGPPRVAAAEPPAPPKGGKSFLWPVRGRIVSGFGSATEGEKNDGINIASPKGTPINAAESGVVVYVGNELRSFGNLMLIKHPDGWYTAYAHADSFLVKKGDTVRRGQPIGRVGTVGASGDSQLHFEIRRGEKPVDPADYLPQLNS